MCRTADLIVLSLAIWLAAGTSHSQLPLITLPTLISETSATLLDHIYSNSNLDLKECRIIYSSLSDHLPVFSLTKCPPNKDIPENQPI